MNSDEFAAMVYFTVIMATVAISAIAVLRCVDVMVTRYFFYLVNQIAGLKKQIEELIKEVRNERADNRQHPV